jgi:phosphoglycerol transferase MdoB-like AlkP superfamily enzyme
MTRRLMRAGLVAGVLFVGIVVVPVRAAGPPALAWEMIEPSAPRVFWAGRNFDMRVRLRNVGSATWSEKTGDHLSYHWLTRDGKVVENDGLRTVFPNPVAPGETVTVEARVGAPADAGRWLFEWEMVREQVRWYGPPATGSRLRFPVFVVWRCGLFEFGFLALSIAAVLACRRLRPGAGTKWWLAVEAGPVVWTWLAVLLATVTFSEVMTLQLWRGGGALAASAAALLALPVALIPGRWRSWAAAAIVLIVTFVALADVVYLRFFESIAPVVAIVAAGQLGQIEGSIKELFRSTDAWLLVGVVSAGVIAALWPRVWRSERPSRRSRLLAAGGAALACLVAGLPACVALDDGLHNPALADQVFSQQAMLGRWGLVNVHLFDVLRTYREWAGRETPNPAQLARTQQFFARRAARAAAAAAGHDVAKGDNLILIQVESLQQWVVGARIRGAEITPFLNELREHALYFPYLFDETGQGRSSDAEFEVLNSQHALDRGAVAFRRPFNHFVALPAVLRDHGYTTLSAHPFKKGFWNRGVVHPREGFETMLFKHELGPGENIGWGLADGVFLSRMAEQLALRRQPFFAFLITLGLHHPFAEFPDRHKVLDVGDLKGTPLGNYIHEVHYFDASFARFIAELRSKGMLDHSIVALYGDHESGLSVDKNLLALAGHAHWDPSVLVRLRRIPFFVLLPGEKLAGEVPVAGGHVDVAPTLLALLGVKQPPVWVGHALDPAFPSFAVLNDGSVVGGDRMYVDGGPRIPANGACFSWPSGSPRPRADCSELERDGQEELKASRFVVIHDLAQKLESRLAASH